jgi:hypothetical protein
MICPGVQPGKCGSPNCERNNDDDGQVDGGGEAHSGNSDRYASVFYARSDGSYENKDEKDFLKVK